MLVYSLAVKFLNHLSVEAMWSILWREAETG